MANAALEAQRKARQRFKPLTLPKLLPLVYSLRFGGTDSSGWRPYKPTYPFRYTPRALSITSATVSQ